MITVNLGDDVDSVEVINRDGSAEIYFTVDGSNPTVEGNDCAVLPAAIGALEIPSQSQATTVVKLISAATPKYSVGAVTAGGYGGGP